MEFGNAAAVAEGAGSRGAGQRWRHEVGLGILGCLHRPSRGTNAGPSVVVSKGSEGNAKGTRREFEGNEAAGEREQHNGAF